MTRGEDEERTGSGVRGQPRELPYRPDDPDLTQGNAAAKRYADRQYPGVHVTYAVIDKAGLSELERGNTALAWSGFAAGLSMGFSFLGMALVAAHLPEREWTPLVTSLGYTLGFLVVILGAQQLYTENTLTAVVPVLARRSGALLGNMLRLWGVVLIANLAGAFLFALVLQLDGLLEPRVVQELDRIATEAMAMPWLQKLVLAVFAGWLIALMVWMLPAAHSFATMVVIILTYFVALGGMPHVIAGAVEAFYDGLAGRGLGRALIDYVLPALIGNTIGGVALVAGLAHAQVVGSGEG